MRVAVLADAHGNILALQAVLADLRAAAPDLVVNLGDLATVLASTRTVHCITPVALVVRHQPG